MRYTSDVSLFLSQVAADASALVCYITRFTEENFATLISLIFIIEAVKNVLKIGQKMPINTDVYLKVDCDCVPPLNPYTESKYSSGEYSNASRYSCLALEGRWSGVGCEYVPDVFLLSVVLFATTFILAIGLKNFKFTSYFPTCVRSIVSDFAVVISILSVSESSLLLQISREV